LLASGIVGTVLERDVLGALFAWRFVKVSGSFWTVILWRKAERVGVVQPGEEEAPGRPYCSLSICKRGLIRKMERDFLPRPVVTGQRATERE